MVVTAGALPWQVTVGIPLSGIFQSSEPVLRRHHELMLDFLRHQSVLQKPKVETLELK